MFEIKTHSEIQSIIASKIKRERLRQKIKQEDFALKAGISLTTYKAFENHGKGTFENFIKITIALGKVNELEKILNEPEFSPKSRFSKKIESKPIQRVRDSSLKKSEKKGIDEKEIKSKKVSPFSLVLSKTKQKG